MSFVTVLPPHRKLFALFVAGALCPVSNRRFPEARKLSTASASSNAVTSVPLTDMNITLFKISIDYLFQLFSASSCTGILFHIDRYYCCLSSRYSEVPAFSAKMSTYTSTFSAFNFDTRERNSDNKRENISAPSSVIYWLFA